MAPISWLKWLNQELQDFKNNKPDLRDLFDGFNLDDCYATFLDAALHRDDLNNLQWLINGGWPTWPGPVQVVVAELRRDAQQHRQLVAEFKQLVAELETAWFRAEKCAADLHTFELEHESGERGRRSVSVRHTEHILKWCFRHLMVKARKAEELMGAVEHFVGLLEGVERYAFPAFEEDE